MKKLLLLCVLIASAMCANAERQVINGINYELYLHQEWIQEIEDYQNYYRANVVAYDDNNDYLNNGQYYKDKIVIPSTVEYQGITYQVKAINWGAFNKCYDLIEVSIPEGVEYIDGDAFRECRSLETVRLPESLEYIGSCVFYNCNNLQNINIPSKLSRIEHFAFGYCRALDNITLPSSLKYISSYVFHGCESLKSINIPDGVTALGERIFTGCTSLTKISIGAGVQSIGQAVFENCSSLESIELPATVNMIGEYAFNCCFKLKSVSLKEGIKSLGECCFSNCLSLTSIQLPSTISSIGRSCFSDNRALREINLPMGLKAIPEHAFYNCNELVDINIPISVTSIGASAFIQCYKLPSITIPEGVKSLPSSCFYDCQAVESISLPSTLSELGNNVFQGCKSLKSINLPEGIKAIPENCFERCENLVEINLPSTITSLGSAAFQGCVKLQSITLPNGIQNLPDYLFSSCSSIAEINLPSSISSLGVAVFSGCTKLESISLPDNITSLPESTFSGCQSLKHFDMPASVTSLGNSVFNGCKNLETINLNEGIKTIPEYAFNGCSSLKAIRLPSTVTTIGTQAFNGCTNIEVLELNEGLRNIPPHSFANCQNLESITIPSTVREIGDGAFAYCYKLKEVVLCEGIEKIPSSLFYECNSLESINIPSTVTYIGQSAFENCASLRDPVIGSGVTKIVSDAFRGVNGTIHVEASVPPKIDFYDMGGNSGESPIDPNTEEGTFNRICAIAVPAESAEVYRNAWARYEEQIVVEGLTDHEIYVTAMDDNSDVLRQIGGEIDEFAPFNVVSLKIHGSINSRDIMIMRTKMRNLRDLDLSDARIVYNEFPYYDYYGTWDDQISPFMFARLRRLQNIVLPESATMIGSSAFRECNNLKSVVFSDNITSIEGDAFFSCTNLQEIDLPKNLEYISWNVFSECYNLKSVSFPPHLKRIDSGAFQSCYSLEEIMLPTSLQYIGGWAFSGCNNLKEVRIPESIEKIENGAFACNNIRNIYTWTIAPISIGQDCFRENAYTRATLHVPETSFKNYYFDTQWGQFLHITSFNEPYTYFYLKGQDLVLDEETARLEGVEGQLPEADITSNAGMVVHGSAPQNLGEVNSDTSTTFIGETSTEAAQGGNLNIDRLVIQISITNNRWYFFCFPFDVPWDNIRFNGQFVWRYYDGEFRAAHGQGAWKGNGTNKLNAGQGYIFQGSKDGILYITANDVTITSEDQMVALQGFEAASEEDASWNLVGNPYTSYYHLCDLGYTAPITIWNPNTLSYEAWNPQDDDIVLHPYEAFFVQKPADQEGVEYYPEYRETYQQTQDVDNQQAARARRMARARTSEPRYVMNIEVSNGTVGDKTRVVFNEKRSLDYERVCDAAKFMSDQAPQLYTLDSRNVRYAINERPHTEGVVRLGFTAIQAGTYTISASRMDVPLYLIDLDNNQSTDLSAMGYEFDIEKGTHENRFVLSTAPSLSGVADIDDDNDNERTYYDMRGIKYNDMPNGFFISDGKKQYNNK